MRLNNKEFYQIVHYIKKNYGVNLVGKKAFVEKNIDKVINQEIGFPAFMERIEAQIDNRQTAMLVEVLVNNYTYFNREEAHYKLLEEVILPKIYKSGNKKKGIRIWSAACSSGQEAYTAIMLILDFLKEEAEQWNIEVIGTDVSNAVIKKAREGIYTKDEMKQVPEQWLHPYFIAQNNNCYKINDACRQKAHFSYLNLASDFEFDKLYQVIFLRNVLIYFEDGLINQIVDKAANYLETGGYLFIGLSETVEINSNKLICVQPSVYRKI